MRILHIINSLNAGGAEKLIDESIPIMQQYKNVDVEVLLLDDSNIAFDKKLKQNNIKLEVVPIRKVYSPRNIYYLRKYIIKGKYDIVHSHLFPSNYWVSIASLLISDKKPRFITTEHSTHNKRRDKFYFRQIEKFIYSKFNLIISISKGTQDNLIKWIKPKEKDVNKFEMVGNGISLEDFKDAKPHIKSNLDGSFNENTRLISMVGSFSKQKDQATIIKAMKLLSEDIYLLLVGDGPLRQENEKLANELGISNRIKFLGIRNDVPRIFKTSDIVIVSSHWEGFGLVAAEGMAAGKPVIASDIPGLGEVVRGAGILFEKGNTQELSSKINNLFEDKSLYDIISKKCINRSKDYDVKRMVLEYLRLYSEVTK